MQRKLNPHTYAAGFLALSAALSLAVLAVRNLYDDEITSFDYVTRPFSGIVRSLSQGDVHPPGMYLLAHLAYCIVPSFRWLNLFSLLFFYAGLSVFVLCLAPAFVRTRSQIFFVLLSTLHPQLLLWNNTFRWYSWWTALALIALVVALQPRAPLPRLSLTRALGVAMLLAGLFYLNYITLLFAIALAVAMGFRYRGQARRQIVVRALLIVVAFASLITPQLHTMFTVHLANSEGQRSSIVVSFIRLALSLTQSETFLPWHPLAIATAAVFAGLCVISLSRLRDFATPMLHRSLANSAEITPGAHSAALDPHYRAGVGSILLFGSTFLALIAASGLGGKPRNGLLLIPVFAPVVAMASDRLRPRLQTALLIFFAIWSATGAAHLLVRTGIAKASMNDRPEEIIAFVKQTTGGTCPLVVTYDVQLAFALSQSRLPGLILISGTGDPILMRQQLQPAIQCNRMRLYAVRSYLGDSNPWTIQLADELKASTMHIQGAPQTNCFSPDPDAATKRRIGRVFSASGDLSGASALPDYRYIITSGAMDPRRLPDLLAALPEFVSNSGPAVPQP